VLLLFLVAGCPDSSSQTPVDAASVTSGVPSTGKIVKKHDPKPVAAEPARTEPEGPFSHDAIIELYRADLQGDASVKKKHGLLDDQGKVVKEKEEAYEAALQRFASEHGDELSRLADELDAANVTSERAADVPRK
jgi:hypothetical protein